MAGMKYLKFDQMIKKYNWGNYSELGWCKGEN